MPIIDKIKSEVKAQHLKRVGGGWSFLRMDNGDGPPLWYESHELGFSLVLDRNLYHQLEAEFQELVAKV